MQDYNKQALDFLEHTNTTLKLEFIGYKVHFDDNVKRNVWEFTLKNSRGIYRAEFGASIRNSFIQAGDVINGRKVPAFKVGQHKKPTPQAYDILACLGNYVPEDFDEFCADYGYEAYSEELDAMNNRAYRMYKACRAEYKGVKRLFTPADFELLQEIQ